MEAAKDSSSVVMENYSDDDGAGGEAARPMIAQGLVNCGDDDNDRMVVERLPRIVARDDGDGNGAGGEAVEDSSAATGGGNSSGTSCVVKQSN